MRTQVDGKVNTMRRWWVVWFLSAILAGCSGRGSLGDVSADVTLDGQPLADGVVHFTPLDGQAPTKSTFIAVGRIHEQVPVGKHRVQISSVQVPSPRPGQAADSLQGREVVPERYNTRSELEADVKPGKNEFKWELTSK